jgi:hypothetical protein
MSPTGRLLILFATAAAGGTAQENLRYSVNWPSGLSLGEAQLETTPARDGKPAEHRFTLEASIPGFSVLDQYRSLVTPGNCSIEFSKKFQHGSRKTEERVEFKPAEKVAIRQTLPGGGKSTFTISPCMRDALAYLYWLRSELAAGRLPPAQTIVFGAQYQLSVVLTGQENLQIGSERLPADRLTARLKGPASERTFDLYFGRDPQRRLLLVRVPLPLGSFALELIAD